MAADVRRFPILARDPTGCPASASEECQSRSQMSRGAIARYGYWAISPREDRNSACRVEAKLDFNRRFRRAHVNEPLACAERAWNCGGIVTKGYRIAADASASTLRPTLLFSASGRISIRRRKTERSAWSASGLPKHAMVRPEERIELSSKTAADGSRSLLYRGAPSDERMFSRRSREQKIEAGIAVRQRCSSRPAKRIVRRTVVCCLGGCRSQGVQTE